jgi:hypothetical protein
MRKANPGAAGSGSSSGSNTSGDGGLPSSSTEDAAFQAVADASGGLVKVGPPYLVPDCNNSYEFANDTNYTVSASNPLAMQLATYYIAHP